MLDIRAALSRPSSLLRNQKKGRSLATRDLVSSSLLFDPTWYTAAYPDVAAHPIDPIDHYLRYGAPEGRDPGPLFSTTRYLTLNEDVAAERVNPLVHYLQYGRKEGRRIGNLLDPAWYLFRYPDVASAGLDPFLHFLEAGMQEGRQPNQFLDPSWYAAAYPTRISHKRHAFFDYTAMGWREGMQPGPLFSPTWYRLQNSDVGASEPLAHFLASGRSQGRLPTPLFDPAWYLSRNVDVAGAGIDPLDHFANSGASEGRQPNIYFVPQWYAAAYPDVVITAGEAFSHYTARGWREGCNPGPRFSVKKYLAANPDVAAQDLEPLQHFLALPEHQRGEPPPAVPALSGSYLKTGQISAAALTKLREDQIHALNGFFVFSPMNIEIDRTLSLRPAISIILPGLNRRYATGGPNTAYILGCLLASEGVSVNFISLDAPPDTDLEPLKLHLKQISGIDVDNHDVRFQDAHNREVPFKVGYNDIFLATAWWTAHPASAAASLLRNKEIYYLIQDYESLFYGLSTSHALARQTYDLPHRPIVNTKLLLDQLSFDRVGLYRDEAFSSEALFFDPAVDRNHFYTEPRRPAAPRKFLFYTRPTMAERNLFGLGVAALRAAVEVGAFEGASWEFIGMGEGFDPIDLGRGHVLQAAPWLDFKGYGELMRSADILLSLMMSPHPSYPPLEMAACRGIAVTTTYGVKTSQRLSELSAKIIGVLPTIDDVVEGIVRARIMSESFAGERTSPPDLPSSWREALLKVVPALIDRFKSDGIIARASRHVEGKPLMMSEKSMARFRVRHLDRAILDRRVSDYRLSANATGVDVVTVLQSVNTAWIESFAQDLMLQDTERKTTWFLIADERFAADLRRLMRPYVGQARLKIELKIATSGTAGLAAEILDRSADYLLAAPVGIRLSEDALRVLAAFAEQSAMPEAIAIPVLRAWDDTDELLSTFDPIKISGGGKPGIVAAVSRAAARRPTWLTALTSGHDVSTMLARCWVADGLRPAELVERIAQAPSHNDSAKVVARQQTETGANVVKAEALSPQSIVLPEIVDLMTLRTRLADVADGTWLWLLSAEAVPPQPHEMANSTTLSMNENVYLVGGCVSVDGKIVESAFWFGGRCFGSHGPFAGAVPQEVGAVSARGALVRADLLRRALPELPSRFGLSLLGPWLGALAQEESLRVVLNPLQIVDMAPGSDIDLGEADSLRLALRFGDLGNRRFGRPFRAAGDDDQILESPPREPWFFYRRLLEERVSACRERLEESKRCAPITILTTVYSRTDPALFQITADAVRDQIRAPAEWIVLAHGPIPHALSVILDGLSSDGLIRLYREPVNLGIHGGLRFCLERASQPFSLCLDADDVLTEDAVEILDQARQAYPEACIFYTDEDLLIGGHCVHAFRRPDYDPVHLRAHSFIWHSILFSTETALNLGAFTSGATQYAQDWDILLRFEFASLSAQHIREVICHWRQHERSLSNSGETFQGSLDSVQAALEFVRQHSERPEDLSVRPYPANVGMPDFYLERLPRHLPSIAWCSVGSPHAGIDELTFAERFVLDYDRGASGMQQLREITEAATATFIFVTGPMIALWENAALWSALRHFELCATVDYVGGLVSRPSGEVVAGPSVRIGPNLFFDRLAGSSMLDRGTDMLTRIKAQAVDALSIDLVLARRTALLAALDTAPSGLGLRSVGAWLGEHATRHGRVLAYEPLFRAVTRNAAALVGDTARGLSNTSEALAASGVDRGRNWHLRGAAGLLRARNIHER